MSFGPGYEERGGWAWYTGSAARMLSAAYGLLGLAMRDRELVLPADPTRPRGRLVLRRLAWRGRALIEAGRALPGASVATGAGEGTLSPDRAGP